MSTTVRQAFGLMSSAGTGKLPAALFTSTSMGPSAASTWSKAVATGVGLTDVAGHADGPTPGVLDGRHARPPGASGRG